MTNVNRILLYLPFFVLVIFCGLFFLNMLLGPSQRPDPSPEQRCAEVADDLCPGSNMEYKTSQVEACRLRVFELCFDAKTIETCRDECAEIVRDLAQANEGLWEQWFACVDGEAEAQE